MAPAMELLKAVEDFEVICNTARYACCLYKRRIQTNFKYILDQYDPEREQINKAAEDYVYRKTAQLQEETDDEIMLTVHKKKKTAEDVEHKEEEDEGPNNELQETDSQRKSVAVAEKRFVVNVET